MTTDTTVNSDNSFDYSNFEKIREYEAKHFWYLHRKEIIHFFVKKYPGDQSKGIELGAGIGQNAIYLEQQKISIDCAEYYQDAVNFIKESGFKGSVRQINLLDPNETIGSYKFYGLFDVLEHFDNPEIVLKNLFQQCPQGSYVMASVPAYRFLWSKKDQDVGHKNRFYQSEFAQLFEQSGFQVTDRTYIFSYLFLPLLLSRWLGVDKQSEYKIKPLPNMVMRFLGKFEIFLLSFGIRFPFGGSVFLVARKP